MPTSVEFRAAVVTRRLRQGAGVRLTETVHRPDAATGRHSHGGSRLCLVVAGAFEESDRRGSWSREAGTMLLYPADTEHDNRFSRWGARCLNIEVPARAVPPSGGEPGDEVVDLGPRPSWLGMRIYDELRSGGDRRSLTALIGRLLAELRRRGGPVDGGPPAWIRRARELIEERATEGMSLSEVADSLDVSRSVLARAFREHNGCSVGEYRHRVLVRRARHSLLATDTPLSAIAYRLGFADQSHFTRVFKRHTSLPPGRYRDAGH